MDAILAPQSVIALPDRWAVRDVDKVEIPMSEMPGRDDSKPSMEALRQDRGASAGAAAAGVVR